MQPSCDRPVFRWNVNRRNRLMVVVELNRFVRSGVVCCVESVGLMSGEGFGEAVGYSVFDTNEECYEYNENACYIAAGRESAEAFREACDLSPHAARIDPVMWDDLLRDFGSSGGEYAMEADAFARFEKLARQHGVSFEADAYDRRGLLMVVQLD